MRKSRFLTKTKIISLIQFEWEKRFYFPIFEMILITFLITVFLLNIDKGIGTNTSILQNILDRSIIGIQYQLTYIEQNFLILAIIVTFVPAVSIGNEIGTKSFSTVLMQAQISRRNYLIGKCIIDILILLLSLIISLLLLRIFSPTHLPLNFSFTYIIYLISKLFFSYSITSFLCIWQKQLILPFIITLLFWYTIPFIFPIIIVSEPWKNLLRIDELILNEIQGELNIILLQFSLFFIIGGLLILFLLIKYFEKMDLN